MPNTALVEEVALTPPTFNDGRAGPAALPDTPGEVFADSDYRSPKGGNPRIAATSMWGWNEHQRLARLVPSTSPFTASAAESRESSAP